MAQAGLVVSQTGSMGGSRLATDPAKTTLLDVYQALECGGVFSLHRQPPSRDCPVGVNIETVLGEVLQEVDSAVELVLKNITIGDVVQRLRPCGTLTNVKNSRLGTSSKKSPGKSLARSNGRLNGKAAKVLRTV